MLGRFQERIEPVKDKLPEGVSTVIEDELAKLSGLEQASSEFNVTRNYLDWLTSLPWGTYTEEKLDIDHAKQVWQGTAFRTLVIHGHCVWLRQDYLY